MLRRRAALSSGIVLNISKAREVLQWTKNTGVPCASGLPAATIEDRTNRRDGTSDRTVRHQLVANIREFFEAARLSEVGYLRPFKRNLVDVFVSRETLSYALDTANELFQAFEDHGHHVTLAATGEFHRPPLSVREGHKSDYDNGESWSPGRKTVVFIGSVAFGLTVYETTEEADVRYDWNGPIRYIRVSTVPTKNRRGTFGFPKKAVSLSCQTDRNQQPALTCLRLLKGR